MCKLPESAKCFVKLVRRLKPLREINDNEQKNEEINYGKTSVLQIHFSLILPCHVPHIR